MTHEDDCLNFLKNDLSRYEELINEFSDLDGIEDKLCHEYVGSIYVHKYDIIYNITYLGKKGIDVSGNMCIYDELNKKWQKIESKYYKIIIKSLSESLTDGIKKYKAGVDFFDIGDSETPYYLWVRDSLEMLIKALKIEFNESKDEEERELQIIDDKLKYIFNKNKGEILSNLQYYEYKPYYPDNFWWRHPSKLFSGEIK